ncbi:MAG: 5-formyltetrahydrofolate cyclo-ligase [Paraprevotella sp.]|nr:5-formyltetrahydrofolate cyclo-ligase [Paraprevotella sp.]
MDKQQLRQYIRTKKAGHTQEERLRESTEIERLLEMHPYFQKAHTILAYHALPDEVQTKNLLTRWSGEKRFILPVVKGNDLELRIYKGESNLHTGAFGIPEPEGDAFTDLAELDLALIPGMAFDPSGHRLGRGKGYYDRLLARLRPYRIPTMGICFSYQKVSFVPTEEHDIPMDRIL